MGSRPLFLNRTCPPDNPDILSGLFGERVLWSLPVTRTDNPSLYGCPLSGKDPRVAARGLHDGRPRKNMLANARFLRTMQPTMRTLHHGQPDRESLA